MRTLLLILVGISAVLAIPMVFPHAGNITISQAIVYSVAGICFLAISVFGVLVAAHDLLAKAVPRESALLTLFLALILPGTTFVQAVVFHAGYTPAAEWTSGPGGADRLNYWLRDYVSEHPSSVSYPDPNSEEVVVDGFLDYVRENVSLVVHDRDGRSRKMQIRSDGIYTTWGARIRFAIDRNRDGYIDAGGQRIGVRPGFANPYTDRPDYHPGFASAIFVSLPDPMLPHAVTGMIPLDSETYARLAPMVHAETLKQ